MEVQINGIRAVVDDDEARRILMERLIGLKEPRLISSEHVSAPRIGVEWAGQGGIYAGIGVRGGEQGHLIVGPEYPDALDWSAAMSWASNLHQRGFADFVLPWRKAQALCFANVPELFKPDSYYWSSEQHESYSIDAWFQGFNSGGQGYWSKDNKLRARAVRWLPI